MTITKSKEIIDEKQIDTEQTTNKKPDGKSIFIYYLKFIGEPHGVIYAFLYANNYESLE